jgi:hypothetical protein
MAEAHRRRERLIWRRALALGLAVALLTQAAWMVPYYLATNGCFCSHGGGEMPSWVSPGVVRWIEIGTMPATAVLYPTSPWIYIFFNAAFWIAVVLALASVPRPYQLRVTRSP